MWHDGKREREEGRIVRIRMKQFCMNDYSKFCVF